MSGFLEAKEQTITERVLVTGVCNSTVVGINPDKEELAKIIGRNAEDIKEPSYVNSDSTRIDIWLKPVEGTEYFDPNTKEYKPFTEPYKLAIFLTDKERTSQSGNKMIMNGKLQNTWAKSVDEALERTNAQGTKWFSSTSARVAKEGEDILYEFFAKYVNANLRDEDTNLIFSDYDAILKGDTSELEAIVKAKNEEGKTINVLLGVNNGIYQEVYSYGFERGTRKTFSTLIQKAAGEYSGFRADFGGESRLKAYVRPTEPQNSTESDTILGDDNKSDDLPF